MASLEVVNKEALYMRKGGGFNGQANKVLNGINYLRNTMLH